MSEQLAQLEKKGGGDLRETVLWTNPSPTAALNTTTITLSDDINNYKYLKIVWKENTSRDVYVSVIVEVDEFKTSTNADAGSASNAFAYCSIYFKQVGGSIAGARMIHYVTDTSLRVTIAYELNATRTNTTIDIPYQVIGLK